MSHLQFEMRHDSQERIVDFMGSPEPELRKRGTRTREREASIRVVIGGFVAGLALGAVMLIAFALVARGRLTAPRGKVQQANDLADHPEYEGNLAQQEVIRRLEEVPTVDCSGVHGERC